MNVQTITMEPRLAQAKLEAYRQQLRRRADEEYEAAVLGYEALAEGTPLINLSDVFAKTGLGEDGRPRLAIARADRKQVQVTVDTNRLTFDAQQRHRWNYQGSLRIQVPLPGSHKYCHGYALVPMVPADVRPNGSLKELFVLWEVEKWSSNPLVAIPDYDPYLLRHIVGDLYAVVAEWDLTELERAIMTGRRQN